MLMLIKHYQVLTLQLAMLRKSKSGIAATGSIAVGGGTYIIFTQETEEGMTVGNWEV